MDLRSEIKTIIASLMVKHPLLATLLQLIRIIKVNEEFALTMDERRIFIGNQWSHLNNAEKVKLLLHATMHIFLSHVERTRNIARKIVTNNPEYTARMLHLIADVKVAQYLEHIDRSEGRLIREFEYMTKIKNVKIKSFEEIVLELFDKVPIGDRDGESTNKDNLSNLDLLRKKHGFTTSKDSLKFAEQEILHKGSEELCKCANEDLDKVKKDLITKAVVQAKTIGTEPGELMKLFLELIESKIDWKQYLRNFFARGGFKDVKRTFTRFSRRFIDDDVFILPGKEGMGMNKVLVLIDSSGSISEEESRAFVSEVYELVKHTMGVIVILWDAEPHEVIEISSPEEIEKIKNYYGGGTMICSTLEEAIKHLQNVKFVVIFTDGYIGDLPRRDEFKSISQLDPQRDAELLKTVQLLRKIASQAKILFVTTGALPTEMPWLTVIKYEREEWEH